MGDSHVGLREKTGVMFGNPEHPRDVTSTHRVGAGKGSSHTNVRRGCLYSGRPPEDRETPPTSSRKHAAPTRRTTRQLGLSASRAATPTSEASRVGAQATEARSRAEGARRSAFAPLRHVAAERKTSPRCRAPSRQDVRRQVDGHLGELFEAEGRRHERLDICAPRARFKSGCGRASSWCVRLPPASPRTGSCPTRSPGGSRRNTR